MQPPHCAGGSSGVWKVLPQAKLDPISPQSHMLMWALSSGRPPSAPTPTVSLGQPCSVSVWVELPPPAPHPLIGHRHPHAPHPVLVLPPHFPLPPRSRPKRAGPDQHAQVKLRGQQPALHQRAPAGRGPVPAGTTTPLLVAWGAPTLLTPPPLSSPDRPGAADTTEGTLSPESHSRFTSKDRTGPQVWCSGVLSSSSCCLCPIGRAESLLSLKAGEQLSRKRTE